MIRVYVAGKYNDTNVIGVLRNMRRGIWVSVKLMLKGYAPYCPWADWIFAMFADMPGTMYKAASMEWLKVSHVIFLVPGWEDSPGTWDELEVARSLGIPVFTSIRKLNAWRKANEAA
jgi:hypothetical protein